MTHLWRVPGALILAMGLLAPAAAAQTAAEWQAGQLHATRGELEELLRGFDEASSSDGYSDSFRALQRQEADLIRRRLVEGDFQTGDQIDLVVTGQAGLTNTFVVSPGQVLQLPEIGEVSLRGLLRSELKQAITDFVAQYIREPQVFVTTRIRLSLIGEVGTPGYHVVPAQALLTDAIMIAGGPSRTSRQDKMRIKRGGDVIWEGEPLQQAIIEGRTLDQLSLRAGDEIELPIQSQRNWWTIVRSFGYLIPLGLAISRLF